MTTNRAGDFDQNTGEGLQEYLEKLTKIIGPPYPTPYSTYKTSGPDPGDESLIFNTATLNDILTRLRQLEQVVSALLLARGLTKEEDHEKIV
jgi:hypothetical protein